MVKSDATIRPSRRFRDILIKAAFSALILFLFALPGRAEGQAVRSFSRVEHIRTDSFDIYFPPSLDEQGQRLAAFADKTLADLLEFLGAAAGSKDSAASGIAFPSGRIAVLLSDVEPDLNAYSTAYPSNRIVFYVSSAGLSGELASLEDELRSVFIHELTHTVTFNMRSPFWAALASVGGDFVAPVSWIMPEALVEGTAVLVESGYGAPEALREGAAPETPSAAPEPALPRTGRLHDPAALEPVYQDILRGRRRGLWDVSGVADYPGSGGMPYYYGALFASFMEERYGGESIRDLWRLAAQGNIFTGFDGTFGTRGLLWNYTGRQPAALWNEFLDWLGSQAEETAGPQDAAIAAAGRRIGAFHADESRVYYLDQERRNVFALDLESGQARPLKLFPGDGYIEDLWISADGGSLGIDWIRIGFGGRITPARYFYDFGDKTMSQPQEREVEKIGAAAVNLEPGAPLPFLHKPRLDPSTGYRYGLVRMGTRVMPARLSADGAMEILDSPLLFVRSLALAGSPPPGQSDGFGQLIAMSAASAGGLSRIAVLVETAEGWKLYLQKAAPEGGAFSPVFAGRKRLIYKAALGDGEQELRVARFDESTIASYAGPSDVAWKPLEAMRASLSERSAPASASTENGEKIRERLKPTLFPRLLSASLYPFVDSESAGLTFIGSDLTERLSWKASAGWDYAANVPETSFTLGLAVDEHYLTLAAIDSTDSSSAGVIAPTRVIGAAMGYRYNHYLLPVNRRIWTSAAASFAGLDEDYAVADYIFPDFGYSSAGGSVAAGYSSMRSLPFAPFDRQGIAFSGGGDYEVLPGTISALSFSGALSFAIPRPAAKLSLYGAWTPSNELLFHPRGRYYAVGGAYYSSALSAPYPDYKEYALMGSGSPWYGFGELAARIATFELWETIGPIPMPFLPSWAIRRVSFWGGLRAALLEQAGLPVLPYSAFARMETDIAVLAGLVAEAHIAVNIEASWAFSSALSGGQALHLDFGMGVTY